MRILIVLSLLSLLSCASQQKYEVSDLKDRILKFRTGFTGLTYNACVRWDSHNNCEEFQVKEYSLDDAGGRRAFNEMKFVCYLAGKRYKICMDKAGLCHRYRVSCGFLGMDRCWREDYIEAKSNNQFLVDSGCRCFSTDTWGESLE